MITNIVLENFKCFRKVEVNPRLITVFVGPNGTGKSSVLQALTLLKQSVNRGTIRAQGELIDLEITPNFTQEQAKLMMGFGGVYRVPAHEFDGEETDVEFAYRFDLGPSNVREHRAEFTFEYRGTQYGERFDAGEDERVLDMPGARMRIRAPTAIGIVGTNAQVIEATNNALVGVIEGRVLPAPGVVLSETKMVPATRGLVRPVYALGDELVEDISAVKGLSQQEDQTATNLAYARELEDKLSRWLHSVTGVGIRGRVVPVRSVAVESLTGRGGVNIVAEGFGANSLVLLFMQLARTSRNSTVMIEEPEIHLHPKAQAELASLLVDVAKAESKQLVMTTHSEHIVGRLLTLVAEKKLSVSDLAIYSFEKDEHGVCTADELTITDDGRVEGGLKDFFETDLGELERYITALEPAE